MTTEDLPAADHDVDSRSLPRGVPPDSTIRRVHLPGAGLLDILVMPAAHPPQGDLAEIVGRWTVVPNPASRPLAPPSVIVPLYDCLVGWAAGRAAVVGPPDRLATLESTVVEFASREAELRSAEEQTSNLVDAVVADADESVASDYPSPEHRTVLARRYIDTVAASRRLAALAPAIHAPPVHPPTLASQLGERLRDRARLLERHDLATERAGLAERIAEASRQRADELAIARKQTGLEWMIVVLLVVQTTLLVVDLLGGQATP